jgi:hypothetical protein
MSNDWHFEDMEKELEFLMTEPSPEFVATCEQIEQEDITNVMAVVQDPKSKNFIIIVHAPAQTIRSHESEPVLIPTVDRNKFYAIFSTETIMALHHKFKNEWKMPDDDVVDELNEFIANHILDLFEKAEEMEPDCL